MLKPTFFLAPTVVSADTRVLSLTLYDSTGAVDSTLDLRNYAAAGIAVQHIEIGAPTARPVVFSLPAQDGQADYTQWMGPRLVSLVGVTYKALAGSRSSAWALFAPYLNPKRRPVPTYALDTDQEPRTLVLTPMEWLAPADKETGPSILAFSIQWTASDPVALSVATQTATTSITTTYGGRSYSLSYPRSYPASTGQTGVVSLTVGGNYDTWPTYYIYGPCTSPTIQLMDFQGNLISQIVLDVVLPAGQFAVINTKTRATTLNGDPGASLYPFIDFSASSWTQLSPGLNLVRFTAVSGSPPANLVVNWQNAWNT